MIGLFLRKGEFKMTNIKYMNEEVVIKKAIEVLIKELGPVEAIRFINIPKKKRMEGIKRHRKWQKMLDKSMFFDEIFAE
jgi:broad specificity polyphosphatase/5'/3'-nucleotidase SurE